MAAAWSESWRSCADQTVECVDADLAVLRAWSEELLVRASAVLASVDGQVRLAACVANSSSPDVPLAVALPAIVHLDRWFESHVRSVFHHELNAHERRAFRRLVDAALCDVVRAAEEEQESSLRFVDMLAHDLRAPLGAVVFVTSTLVRAGCLAGDKLRALLRVEQSAN